MAHRVRPYALHKPVFPAKSISLIKEDVSKMQGLFAPSNLSTLDFPLQGVHELSLI